MRPYHDYVCWVVLAVLISASPCYAKTVKIQYRLKWFFNTSVAGDIYADEKGYFQAKGLDVIVKEGGPGINVINELELGRSHFGVASADQVIRAVEKGAEIVVLAQLFQINPMQWIYRADQPEIKTLQDLKGRKIGITYGGNDETIMNTLLAKAGLNQSDVILSSVRFDATPFFKGKVDVWPVYKNSQGVTYEDNLVRSGEKVLFFNPLDFGVNFVANSVITTKSMVTRSPEVAEAFLSALLKAWEAAMDPENEVSVLEAIKKRDKEKDHEIRRKQLAATRELVKPSPVVKIGSIDKAAWQHTEQIMLQEKQIKKAVQIGSRLQQVN